MVNTCQVDLFFFAFIYQNIACLFLAGRRYCRSRWWQRSSSGKCHLVFDARTNAVSYGAVFATG